jgi:hypothetical protein
MNCTGCGINLSPDELFCGDCGTPVPRGAGPAPVNEDRVLANPGAGALSQRGTYSAEISRQNPACLIFLIDQSGSMEEPIAGGTGEKKKQVVADAINRLLYNSVLRCSKEDGVRPYFNIGVWSYDGVGGVRTAFGSELSSITEIAEQPKRMETRKRRLPDGAGGVYEDEFQLPVWFDAVAQGNTPMNAAFSAVVAPLRAWVNQHSASFPPIIINLTDGAYTDQSPAAIVSELMRLGTSDGSTLVFNCHISQNPGMSVTFPSDGQAGGLTGIARELYDMSTPLPEPMRRQAQSKGYQLEPGARGYVYNADLVTMIDFLDIGTRAVQDRTEKV